MPTPRWVFLAPLTKGVSCLAGHPKKEEKEKEKRKEKNKISGVWKKRDDMEFVAQDPRFTNKVATAFFLRQNARARRKN